MAVAVLTGARSAGEELLLANLYDFPLRATARGGRAQGGGRLILPRSPFGIAVSADGHLIYDLQLQLASLPPLPAGAAYVAWIMTPDLSQSERLGVVESGNSELFRISGMNKFLVAVTLEPFADSRARSGPVIMRGVSPSGRLESFLSHELFSDVPHDR